MVSKSDKNLKVLIIAMKTWGEFGNYRAGEVVFNKLNGKPSNFQPELISGEELFEYLRIAGSEMRRIANQDNSLSEKKNQYMEIIGNLDRRFTSDFEVSCSKREEIKELIHVIDQKRPDVIVCMKGILTRLAIHASTFTKKRPYIINFITNQGLLDLPIHRSKYSDLDIVPSKAALEKVAGYSEKSNIHVLPLSRLKKRSFPEEKDDAASQVSGACTIFILSNKGGTDYINIFKSALFHPSRPKVVVVIINDDRLINELKAISVGFEERVEIFSSLSQAEYVSLVREASRFKGSFLVSKTGPNTLFESMILGLPVLMHYSWLPMEDWVADEVHENSLGKVIGIENVSDEVGHWLNNPTRVEKYKLNIIERKDRYLAESNGVSEQQIVEVVISAVENGKNC